MVYVVKESQRGRSTHREGGIGDTVFGFHGTIEKGAKSVGEKKLVEIG